MKEVIAIVRMNMMNKTKAALTDAGVNAFFGHEAQGRGVGFVNRELIEGAEEGYEEAAVLLGEKGKLYPKRMVTIVVDDDEVDNVVETIIVTNKTGKPGDGKINIIPGWVEPSDMEELKRIAAMIGVKTNMFPDTSGVLDAPLTGEYKMFPMAAPQSTTLKTAAAPPEHWHLENGAQQMQPGSSTPSARSPVLFLICHSDSRQLTGLSML